MIVELAAVRLLAPWFGTSLAVWTNVIAVILLALALGYLLGARLAGRRSPATVLSWILVFAGVAVAWLPRWCSLWAPVFLPSGMALHEAAELVVWGSLAVSLLVFLPPATMLGAVCPLAVEYLAAAPGRSAGRAGGIVLAASTLGSLLGVFGTSHWFLPTLGLSRTFLLAGALLVVSGTCAWLLGKKRALPTGPALLALAGWIPSALSGEPARAPTASGLVPLAYAESPYQSLRVVEDRSREPPLRFLQVNEGFDSFQSVWQSEPGLLPEGFYYNDFVLPLAWTAGPRSWQVLVLGLGAGTVTRVFRGSSPAGIEPAFVGIELDPMVVDLGRTYFDLDTSSGDLEVWSGLDARVALACSPRAWDQIVLDCYANQVEIPPHLCTLEFFRLARGRLAEGGWLLANLGGFAFDDPVVGAVARTCAEAFEAPILLLRVPRSRNFTLLARRDQPVPEDPSKSLPGSAALEALLVPRALPGFVHRVLPGQGPVLTDDHCPVDQLQLRSLLQARARRIS